MEAGGERERESYPSRDENLSEIPLFESISKISKIYSLAEGELVWRSPSSLRAEILERRFQYDLPYLGSQDIHFDYQRKNINLNPSFLDIKKKSLLKYLLS